jgi:membrane-bound metal-dependent hydrolase YbcI (DUF457 family)
VDNLTHSLFGWTLARAGLGRGTPYATATLVLASNAPDADIVTIAYGGIEYLAAHRGPTHGPLGVIGLGLVTAGIIAGWARWRGRGHDGERRAAGGIGTAAGRVTSRSILRWWGLAMVGVTGHLLMDLPTAYGTRLLSPFSATWFAFDWMPIIDVYLWIALVAALVVGRATNRRARWAAVGLALMAFDYAARAGLHQRALAQGAAFDAAGARAPCAAAPSLVTHPAPPAGTPALPGACLAAAALPTFVSPFTWRVVRQSATGYEISDRSVLDPASPLGSTRLTSDAGPDVARARQTRAGQVYFDFARFPIARVAAGPQQTTVRLLDARFVGLPSNDALADMSTSLSIRVTLAAPDRAGE